VDDENWMRVACLVGNIGSGKSTVLNYIAAHAEALAPHCDVDVTVEPVKEWHFFLKRFYENPEQNLWLLQLEVLCHYLQLTKRLLMLKEKCRRRPLLVLVERSPLDPLFVFLKVTKRGLDPQQRLGLENIFESFCSTWIGEFEPRFVRLDSSPEECFERLEKRARTSESLVSKQYLRELHTAYAAGFPNRFVECIGSVTNHERNGATTTLSGGESLNEVWIRSVATDFLRQALDNDNTENGVVAVAAAAVADAEASEEE